MTQVTERQYERIMKGKIQQSQKELHNFVQAFLLDCIAKDEKQVKEIYKRYEKRWVDFARTQNKTNVLRKNKNKVGYMVDAFESSCNTARKRLHLMKNVNKLPVNEFVANIDEYKRIFRIVEHKGNFTKFIYWLEKHFFTKSTKFNIDGTLKVQLKNEQ